MIDRVFLLWQSYNTNELLLLGSLRKLENKGYEFSYEKDALKAEKLGCLLPFTYSEDKISFSSLPPFFAQRMLTNNYNAKMYGINYDPNNELATLSYLNSVKNSDNFSIISEEQYRGIFSKTDANQKDNQVLQK